MSAIDTRGHENGRFRSEHSVVIRDCPRLRGPHKLVRYLRMPLIEALIKLVLSDTVKAEELRARLPDP